MPSVQNSDNGEVEKSEVDAEVEEIVDNLVDSGKSWLARMSNDVSKTSVAKQVISLVRHLPSADWPTKCYHGSMIILIGALITTGCAKTVHWHWAYVIAQSLNHSNTLSYQSDWHRRRWRLGDGFRFRQSRQSCRHHTRNQSRPLSVGQSLRVSVVTFIDGHSRQSFTL